MTDGDVLQLSPGTPQNATAANLVVLASKGNDCRKGTTVTVGVALLMVSVRDAVAMLSLASPL